MIVLQRYGDKRCVVTFWWNRLPPALSYKANLLEASREETKEFKIKPNDCALLRILNNFALYPSVCDCEASNTNQKNCNEQYSVTRPAS